MDILNTFSTIADRIMSFLPYVLLGLFVFLIGLLVAVALGNATRLLLKKTPINSVFEKLGVTKLFQGIGFNVEISDAIGWLVKWFIILVFLVAVADALGLPQVSNFINQIALYIPNVIGAGVILIIGVIVANALSEVVLRTTESAKLVSSAFVAAVTKWAVLIFAFLAALDQLGIATRLVETLFTGITAALVLGLGLAFGLGGKDKAKEIIDKVSKELKEKK